MSDTSRSTSGAYMKVGQRWVDETPGSAPRTWTVTRVGQKKVHLRAEFEEFTATATAWIGRIKVSPYWRCLEGARRGIPPQSGDGVSDLSPGVGRQAADDD